MKMTIHHGDCIEVMRTMADCSVDSIVTDPPYEIGFMGKSWDSTGIAYSVVMWREALRVLKPGGHLLSFGGSRTYHRMACAIEDAGFEIRDQIMWVYGSGFPKSKNMEGDWKGWGTALKPAHEPIVMARKPLIGTVADNVLQFGVGALNIEASRVGTEDTRQATYKMTSKGLAGNGFGTGEMDYSRDGVAGSACGRWPANFIHDGSDEVRAEFPDAGGQQGDLAKHAKCRQSPNGIFGGMRPAMDHPARIELDKNASRFFYCAKASRLDRNEGLNSGSTPAVKTNATMRDRENADWTRRNGNYHPTVKPTELMRYLVRLVTPPSGTVLDPFMGSGSTGKAAMLDEFQFIGIEQDAGHVSIARARIECAEKMAVQERAQQRLFA